MRVDPAPMVDADGRPVHATTAWPTGIQIRHLLLAGVELDCPLVSSPGAVLAGTREPSLHDDIPREVPYAWPDHLLAPPTHAEIQDWFSARTTLLADNTDLYTLAGYSQHHVGNFAGRLLVGEEVGRFEIALMRGAAALVQIRRVLRVDVYSPQHIAESGAMFACRALVDVVDALDHLATSVSAHPGGHYSAVVDHARCIVEHVVKAYRDAVAKAGRRGAKAACKRLVALGECLLDLVDGAFRDSDGTPVASRDALTRLARGVKLTALNLRSGVGGAIMSLAEIEQEIDRIAALLPAARLTRFGWSRDALKGLANLVRPLPERRAWRAAFQPRLIARLLFLRRLREAVTLFAWLAAPRRSFARSPFGAIGAFASILELARAVEIAGELVLRNREQPTAAATDNLLTISRAKDVWRNPADVAGAVRAEAAMGCAIVEGGLTHANVHAAVFAAAHFGTAHMIGSLMSGRIDWVMADAPASPKTWTAMANAEMSKSLRAGRAHSEYVRYMGMTVSEVLLCALVSIFPSASSIVDGNAALGASESTGAYALADETCALVERLLRNVDDSGLSETVFWKRTKDARKIDTVNYGEGSRRTGSSLHLIHLAERRRSLRDTMHGDARKRDNLAAARRLLIWRNVNQPIGDCFEPVLWLVDNPDVHYWNWIQGGGRMSAPLGPPVLAKQAARRIQIQWTISQARAAFWAVYAKTSPTMIAAAAMAVLGTAVSSVTTDHAFFRLRP